MIRIIFKSLLASRILVFLKLKFPCLIYGNFPVKLQIIERRCVYLFIFRIIWFFIYIGIKILYFILNPICYFSGKKRWKLVLIDKFDWGKIHKLLTTDLKVFIKLNIINFEPFWNVFFSPFVNVFWNKLKNLWIVKHSNNN